MASSTRNIVQLPRQALKTASLQAVTLYNNVGLSGGAPAANYYPERRSGSLDLGNAREILVACEDLEGASGEELFGRALKLELGSVPPLEDAA
ncbi:hypothetical protein VTL71DRAFT_9228 [Oculimacula yallundae]|uniref:Uncharacterized protein n=1 Tax=Oculimacula yallundae TaxID=86028 RepID=A0ABR4BT91_9HELO